MPEATCAPRIRALSDKATELKARRDELGLLLDDTSTAPRPSPAHLDALRDRVRDAAGDTLPETVRTLLQAMTERIDVTSRADITPTFRVPITDTTAPSAAAVTGGPRQAAARGLRDALITRGDDAESDLHGFGHDGRIGDSAASSPRGTISGSPVRTIASL